MAARGKPTKNPCCLLASGICSLPAPRAVALTGQPEAICSGYFTRVAATPVTIVNAKIITMPAWTKNDPVTAGSGSAADAKHSPMNPIPINVLPNLRICLPPVVKRELGAVRITGRRSSLPISYLYISNYCEQSQQEKQQKIKKRFKLLKIFFPSCKPGARRTIVLVSSRDEKAPGEWRNTGGRPREDSIMSRFRPGSQPRRCSLGSPIPNNYTDPEGPVTVRLGCHRRRAAANPQKP